MATRKPMFMTAEGFFEEMAATDDLQLGGLAMSGNIAMTNNKITGLGAPSSDADAATKKYVDDAVVSGGKIKEALFTYHELDDTDGINAAGALYFANQPVVGDTVVLKDGTLTRTYTFVANQGAESAATDVSIETDTASAMQRLVTRANADVGNTQWDLYYTTSHTDINAGVVMVLEKSTAAGNADDRIYGVFTTQADLKVVDFTSGTGTPGKEYTVYTVGTASTTDPAQTTFGLRRQQAALEDGEIHFTLDSDELWAWNQDASSWYLLSSGAVPIATSASGGGTLGKVTADEDYGLVIAGSGVLRVDLEPNKGLEFIGGDLAAKPDTAAGMSVGSGGLAVALSGTPGLEFSTGLLQVKADGAHGIVITANGVDIEIDDTPDTLDVDTDGLKVVGLPSLFKVNGTAVGANVTAPNLDTLVGGTSSYADSLHTHARVDAAKVVSGIYTAGENVAKGDPCYVYAANQIGKGDAGNNAKAHIIGVAAAAIAGASTGVMVSEGIVTGVGSGWTANDPIYLADGGGLTNTIPGSNKRVVVVGYAWNATDLFVDIRDYGKKAA